jgi:hypothetical protein
VTGQWLISVGCNVAISGLENAERKESLTRTNKVAATSEPGRRGSVKGWPCVVQLSRFAYAEVAQRRKEICRFRGH